MEAAQELLEQAFPSTSTAVSLVLVVLETLAAVALVQTTAMRWAVLEEEAGTGVEQVERSVEILLLLR
jgi:hypothetical protein